jgi:hypothetical protein
VVPVHWTAQAIDPFGQTWEIDLLEGYEPRFAWQREPATANQLTALRRRGYGPPADLTKGEASAVLDQSSPKQRRLLSRRGLWQEGLSFAEASRIITELARHEGWATAAAGTSKS